MTDNGDWTLAIGCRKAAIQIAVRVPLALATCWAGFWVLRSFLEWMHNEMNRQEIYVDDGLITVVGVVAGICSGQILARGLSDGTGLIGDHLLLPAFVPFLAGAWQLQRIAESNCPEWSDLSLVLYAWTAIIAGVTAWRRLSRDS